jgi:hypothetical protein
MPKKKLTLSVDADVITRAKQFSERNDTSISELVTSFLQSLDSEGEPRSPIVERLRGVIPPNTTLDEYDRYRVEKHL